VQVFLIRHPRPLVEAGVCYGSLDVDCADPEPIASRLKPMLPKATRIYSSPLRRARRLAECLSSGMGNVQIDPRLGEIDFGEWEGRRWDQIERCQIDAWASDVLGFVPPHGESVASLRDRALDFAASVLQDFHAGCSVSEGVALVTHAGIMRVLVGHWRQLPVSEWLQLKFDFGEMVCLEVEP